MSVVCATFVVLKSRNRNYLQNNKLNKQQTMKKNYAMEAYEAPMLEELTIEVEQGFAASGDNDIEPGQGDDWGNLED